MVVFGYAPPCWQTIGPRTLVAAPGEVEIMVDLDCAIDRVSWAVKTARLAVAHTISVAHCLGATPSELRQCEIDLATAPHREDWICNILKRNFQSNFPAMGN